MNKNKYGEVINGKETYKEIADALNAKMVCYIGWTDELFTHYDIVFSCKNVFSEGTHQRRIRDDYLFVSIIGTNAFGFRTDTMKDVGYVSEKLFHNITNETVEKITELINGVIIEI